MQKIQKSGAGYMNEPNTTYECQQCAFYQPLNRRCVLHGSNDVINTFGSCNYFCPAQPGTLGAGRPPMRLVTKQESGYVESQFRQGYSCKRCVNFDGARYDCRLVDARTPGDDPGRILPDACCNLWQEVASPLVAYPGSLQAEETPEEENVYV